MLMSFFLYIIIIIKKTNVDDKNGKTVKSAIIVGQKASGPAAAADLAKADFAYEVFEK